MKKNKFLYTDLCLMPLFVAIVFTGIKLHVGPFASHDEWHNWAVAHVVAGVFFIVAGVIHIKQHWAWYKAFVNKIGNKSCVTILLSLLFIFEAVTGILLISVVEGGGSSIGLWHFGLGLAMAVLGLWHIVVRLKIIIKWLK